MALALLRSKTCSKCEEEKPLDDFPARKSSKDGLHGWCRPCYRNYYSAAGKRWRDENRERHRETQRKRYHADPERFRKIKRDWDASHRDLVNARAREAYKRAWADPVKRARMLEHNARRRSIVEAASTPELTAAISKMYDLPCTYCGATEDIEIDHIYPLARGGSHTLRNLTPACGFCNRSKKDRLLSEWIGEVI